MDITVKQFFKLLDTTKTNHWSLCVWNVTGMIEYAYINEFYTPDLVISSVWDAVIAKIDLGYNSVNIFIKDIPDFDLERAQELRDNKLYGLRA